METQHYTANSEGNAAVGWSSTNTFTRHTQIWYLCYIYVRVWLRLSMSRRVKITGPKIFKMTSNILSMSLYILNSAWNNKNGGWTGLFHSLGWRVSQLINLQKTFKLPLPCLEHRLTHMIIPTGVLHCWHWCAIDTNVRDSGGQYSLSSQTWKDHGIFRKLGTASRFIKVDMHHKEDGRCRWDGQHHFWIS